MTKVIYRSPFIPPEWIEAHGFDPLRMFPGEDPGPGPIPDSEGICPFMRQFVNQAVASDAAAIIITTMCDQMRRAFDMIDHESSPPVFLFNLPSTWQTDSAVNMYIAELQRLGKFLVSAGGSPDAMRKLADIMMQHDSTRRAIPLSTIKDGTVPVMILGGPLTALDQKLLRIVTDANGSIVMDATENGSRTIPDTFDHTRVKTDPLSELARAYFCTIPDVFRRPNKPLFDWIRTQINQYNPSGIIIFRQLWCDLWHAEVHRLREQFKLPILDIDLNGDNPIHRNRTRIQAFMESLA